MTPDERQAAVVRVLILMEPEFLHDFRCPAYLKDPITCNCYLIRNAEKRAAGLDEAGLLVDNEFPVENVNQIDIR